MQERMAANYYATNVAFQNAEGVVRGAECAIEQIIDRDSPATCTAVTIAQIQPICDDGFDPGAWGELQNFAAVPEVNVRKIDQCIQGEAALDAGGTQDANPFPVYQITAYAADSTTNPTSSTVIDTVFKL
jgi:type IV pilus assembly protein PilX